MYSQTEEADRKVVDASANSLSSADSTRADRAGLAALEAVVTAPIVGASKPHHLNDAVAALNVKLTPEEIAALEAPYIPHPVLGFS